MLSGSWHEVYTGTVLVTDATRSSVTRTKVKFKAISDREVERYLETEEPFDSGSLRYSGIARSSLSASRGVIQCNGITALRDRSTLSGIRGVCDAAQLDAADDEQNE